MSLSRRKGRPLVFLAEDDDDLRRLLADALRDAGYDVLSASTGHEMLKLLAAAARAEVAVPDAFVMDVRMPKCTGIDVLTALRLAGWQQPIVMITAFGDPALHERATSYGASVSLDKPVDTDDLIDIIDVLLVNSDRHKRASWLGHGGLVFGHDDAEWETEPETVRSPTNALQVVDAPIDVR